ncbi:MAG: hypothetical protein EON47_01790 [Acetobacteraceae bacterium]|nr:MAG: hypothetical protein EON47_01790 [Acetobacteraceae bacterium]
MRRRALILTLPLAAPFIARAQPRQGPPHEWVFGAWTGGQYPPNDWDSLACFGSPTVIFTRDLVMRATALDTAYRQRTIETVALQPNGLEFRFTPVQPMAGPLGARMPPDVGFGCGGNPNVLRVERRGPDEIVFPGCNEFPSALRRCVKG